MASSIQQHVTETEQQKLLGVLLSPTRPDKVIVQSTRPLSIGEYVQFDSYGRAVLGVVQGSYIESKELDPSQIGCEQDAIESKRLADRSERDKGHRGLVTIIGYIDGLVKTNGRPYLPSVSSHPGTSVYEVNQEELSQIFSPNERKWLELGTLLRNDTVSVKVNINKIYSRHLAILAMSGGGKSNTVWVLLEEIVKTRNTVLVFDYHDDYRWMQIERINFVQPRVRLQDLSVDEFADLLDIDEKTSRNQLSVLAEAFPIAIKASHRGEDFWDALDKAIDEFGQESDKTGRIYKDAKIKVSGKIKRAKNTLGEILIADASRVDPFNYILPGRINIVGLHGYTEKQVNVVAASYLERALDDRKQATIPRYNSIQNISNSKKRAAASYEVKFTKPVLVVLEEAHVFIPKDGSTATKRIAARIAREGRKFGVGLCIVSQRPKAIDVNILSQMNSMMVMRMQQEESQKAITNANETIGENLTEKLSLLNPGEAILTGSWVKIPTFVKVREILERGSGGDIDVVED
jgi:DNA helicase HerA-like ATPase